LEELIEIERKKNSRASDERDWKIKDLRVRLEDLGRDYDELISTKSSLDSEISIYRKLLEGEEKRYRQTYLPVIFFSKLLIL
jgi:hypothetical protein